MYVLAIDIGASSGRHILGRVEKGRITLEEVYRFPNGASMQQGMLCWDREALEGHILAGMKICADRGTVPASVGVCTWGVDYVLLDKAGRPMGAMAAYRDKRTEQVMEKADHDALYRLTGIARQPFNTVYQLMSEPAERLNQAARCLFAPDYFHYFLSGKMANEFTIASTSALLDAKSRDFSDDVFALCGLPRRLFPEPPRMPGADLGDLRPEIQQAVGYNCRVILPAGHDTGSAYMAVPARDEQAVYLSSGTWSLLGVETDQPLLSEQARDAGFTNEGAYGGRVRLLRNIMGLWMLQCVRHELDDQYTFAQMADMAAGSCYPHTVDAGDNRFLNPDSMTEEVRAALHEQGCPVPQTPGDLICCITRSLAHCYALAIRDLEKLTGKRFTTVNIVGGGSNNRLLNQLTADAAGLPVYAGPQEGTALGNVLSQLITLGQIRDLAHGRELVRASFAVEEYLPAPH